MSVSSPLPSSKKPLLSDKVYVWLKYAASVVFPALGTLYFALAQLWHFPHSASVVGSIASVNTFLGVLLGVSTMTYNNSGAQYDGVMHVESSDPDTTTATMVLNSDPADLVQKNAVTFKVNAVPAAVPATPVQMPPVNSVGSGYVPPVPLQ
jgi:hypothetical protein